MGIGIEEMDGKGIVGKVGNGIGEKVVNRVRKKDRKGDWIEGREEEL